MLVLVVLTLFGNGTNVAMEPIRSRTYLSNFLIGGSVGGALTGVYAGLPADQRALIDRGEIGEYENRSTGFGLNIVRLLARSYDGTLDADSSDNGTTATLTLRRGDTDEQTVRHGTGDRVRYYGVAIAWATGLWLVAASLVMPVWLRLVGISAMLPNLQSTLLAGHLVWGLAVVTCYRVGRR